MSIMCSVCEEDTDADQIVMETVFDQSIGSAVEVAVCYDCAAPVEEEQVW